MTVTRAKYRPPHTSEREFAVKNLCRLVVLTAARGVETTGEVFVRQNGTPYTHADRMTIANVLRRYAAKKRGEPPLQAKGFNRDQALYAYAKSFPSGQAKAIDPTMADIKSLLRGGWFLSVSGSVDDVPGKSKLDDWVSDYPHEIGLLPFPDSVGPLVVEPMRPKGAGLIRVSWSDVAKFSSEFATNGERLCIGVRAGYDTKAAQVRRGRAIDLVRSFAARARVRDDLEDALADVAARDLRIASLELDLAQCREDGDPDAARIAALEQAQEAAHDAIEALKE